MERIYKGEIQRLLPIFKAMADGKTIQFAVSNSWIDIDGDEEGLFLDTLIATPQSYRIKPEPKYRPFANAEECWQEMQKHQPFGWVKAGESIRRLITLVDVDRIQIGNQNLNWTYAQVFKKFIFMDGQPFGVKVEE